MTGVRWIARILLVAVAPLALSASSQPASLDGARQAKTNQPSSFEVNSILDRPDSYFGTTIRIRGAVAEVYNDHAFSIQDFNPVGGKKLLVVSATPITTIEPLIQKGLPIRITGMLQKFVADKIEPQYGIPRVPPKVEQAYRGQPVLITGLEHGAAENNAGKTAGIAAPPLRLDHIRDLLAAGQLYQGKSVTLSGRVVSVSARSFILADDTETLAVYLPASFPPAGHLVRSGQRVAVTGVVRRTAPEGRESSFELDLGRQDEFLGRPILILERVRPD
jgi:hypothetical protein